MAEHYRFPAHISKRFRYCGYVCPAPTERQRHPVRANFILMNGHHNAKLIVVMAGGGADAYPMMRATLEALPAVTQHHHCYCLIITGPFMPPELRRVYRRWPLVYRHRNMGAVDDTYGYLEDADLVIAMAGYNTTVEILQSGKHAILVPRHGPSAEQRMHASSLPPKAGSRWSIRITWRADRFATLIAADLERTANNPSESTPDLEGLNSSTDYLLSLLSE